MAGSWFSEKPAGQTKSRQVWRLFGLLLQSF
jgi:hypothetical protein